MPAVRLVASMWFYRSAHKKSNRSSRNCLMRSRWSMSGMWKRRWNAPSVTMAMWSRWSLYQLMIRRLTTFANYEMTGWSYHLQVPSTDSWNSVWRSCIGCWSIFTTTVLWIAPPLARFSKSTTNTAIFKAERRSQTPFPALASIRRNKCRVCVMEWKCYGDSSFLLL